MILKATFRRPTRSDLDLSSLPGGMPPLVSSQARQLRRGRLDGEAHQDPGAASRTSSRIRAEWPGDRAFPASAGRFGTVRAVDSVDLDGRRRRVLHPAGPVGLRQDHAAAHDRGLLRARRRRDPLRRASASTACRPISGDIGMVFQNYAVFPNLTVAGNVAYGLKARKVRGAGDRAAGRGGAGAGPARGLRRALAAPARPAASCSASPSPAPWSSARRSCCSTSRSPISTRACGSACAARSASCRSRSASPRSTSRTTRRRRCRCPTASP